MNRLAHVQILRVEFFLGSCRSLKEKRQRLGGLRERYGKQVNVAVCESAFQDSLQQAQWSFVACAADGLVVEKTLVDIERGLQLSVDAEIVDMQRDILQ